MDILSKTIILVCDAASMMQHKAFMEDMGSYVINVTENSNIVDSLKQKFDIIVVDCSFSCGKKVVDLYEDLLKKVNCIFLVDNVKEGENIKCAFQNAEVAMKPVSPGQLNQKVASMLSIPLRRGIKILVRMQLIEELKTPFILATMIDLSENGMLIETEKQLKLEANAKISFYLPETGGFVELEGQIIRETQFTSPKLKCYGLRFIKVEKQFQDKINRFILKIKSRKF